jgi:uncharacterized protein (TIGR03089 family)
MGEARDVNGLLHQLLSDPGRPRVTWYGPDGERVELSGKVLLNWVSKTANLLVDELDAEPTTTVGLDLPAHWRTITWLLATWAVGGHAVIAPEKAVDVLVTTRPGAEGLPDAEHVVGVALPALATSWPGTPGTNAAKLPAGVVDAAAEVRLQPDVFDARLAPTGDDPAWTSAGKTVPYRDLVPSARITALGAGVFKGDRVFTGNGADDALVAWLGVLALDGSIVLHHDAEAEDGPLLRQEQVTRRR